MSALGFPFWCRVHRDGVTATERPHEARTVAVEGTNGLNVVLFLLQEPGGRPALLEVDVDGRRAVLQLDAVPALINALRDVVGMAQRSGVSA